MSKEYYKKYLCDSNGNCKLYNPLQINGQCVYYNEWCELKDKIADLEAKLAESEKFMKDNGFENLEELDNYIQKIHLHYDEIKNKGTCGLCEKIDNEQIKELKQQLAEKEQTIKEINKEFVQAVKDWKSLVEKKNKDIVELEEHDNLYHNQLAIEQLEKVKEVALKGFELDKGNISLSRVLDKIDNQIKQLKERNV